MDTRLRLWLALASTLLVIIYAPAAGAHSELVAAEPAPGANLSASPPRIQLTFNESIGDESTIVVFGRNFLQVDDIQVVFDPTTPEQLMATLPPLDPDQYTVQWATVSIDGHKASGSYTFSVTRSSLEGTTNESWLLWGAVVVIGIVVAVAGVWWRRRVMR